MHKLLPTILLSVSMAIASNASASAVLTSKAAIPGVASSLRNAQTVIDGAITRAEIMYHDNHVTTPTTPCGEDPVEIIGANLNPYVATAQIQDVCHINITMQNSNPNLPGGEKVIAPLSDALKGVKIKLVAIYNITTGADEKISAWECITDYDSKAAQFLGEDVALTEGATSRIAFEAPNSILGQCVYGPNPF